MVIKKKHIKGKKKGDVLLCGLSTCQWCRKTQELLNELGIDYHYIDVDLVTGDDQKKLLEKITKFNPRCSFPTVIIDEKDAIAGFEEDQIRERFK
jgi:glutaredoxin-like protein NrdH